MRRLQRIPVVFLSSALLAVFALPPVSHSVATANPSARTDGSSLSYSRVEQRQGYAVVYFTFTNRSKNQFAYVGATRAGARLGLQVFQHGVWRKVIDRFCETGLQLFEVSPGGSQEVTRHVSVRRFHLKLRACLSNESRPREVAWSEPFIVTGTLDE